MRARAVLRTELVADGLSSRIDTLRSEAPLVLRVTHPKGGEPLDLPGAARVCLAAGAAGPLGGDELALTVDVGAGSALVLRAVSASLLLPGPRRERSVMCTTVRVADGATLVWLPEPVIAACGCRHLADTDVDLSPGARLVLREELVLGRHGERPGDVVARLRIRLNGRSLLHQELAVGHSAPGWDGPAVTGGRRAVGSLVVVDPAWSAGPPGPVLLGETTALMPLAGPAVLVSALAPDTLTLRHYLDRGLAQLAQTGQPSLVV